MFYDIVIIGGGPAGLTAALYGARSKLKTLIIEKEKTGGQVNSTLDLENFPGIPEGQEAPKLMERMAEQATTFGAVIVNDEVKSIELEDEVKIVKGEKEEYKTKTVIIATGAKPRKLGVKGEKELTGKGVSYCATCDADFFTDLDVVVIGGGDSAIKEAIYLTKFAEKVTVVHRRERLRATPVIQDKAFANDKIEIEWDSVLEEIKGDGIVEKVVLKNKVTGETKEIEANGVFIYVGIDPITDFVKDLIKTDEQGYIITDDDTQTSIEGIYAAGDVRKKLLRQVITGCGEGATAATAAENYIEEHFE